MTALEALAALCILLGSWNNAGSGSHDIACNTSTSQISVSSTSNYWIPTTSQLSDMVAGFNAVSTAAGSSPPTEVDTLGTFLAFISNQEAGNHALAFSGHQLSIVNSSYTYSASGSQLGTLVTNFNALQVNLAGGGGGGGSPFATGGTFARGLIVGGQSLMANYGGAASSPTYYTIQRPIQQWNINPQTGDLGAMTNPMAGVSGSLDSMIPRLVDGLLDNLNLAHIVVGDIAIGGAKFYEFAKGGQYNARIGAMLSYFEREGVKPSCVIWGEGETDASDSTPTATVTAQAMSIIDTFRIGGYAGPIVFALETVSQNSTQPGTSNVITGIQDAVELSANTFIGPNVDTLLTTSDRYAPYTHPNYSGQAKLATAWRSSMMAAGCFTLN